jgi:drug/metabolite transporter (DMT)-like permease
LLIGAGLATVLVDLQVVMVTLAAWLIWDERPTPAQALAVPVALTSVVLISGLLLGSAASHRPGPPDPARIAAGGT